MEGVGKFLETYRFFSMLKYQGCIKSINEELRLNMKVLVHHKIKKNISLIFGNLSEVDTGQLLYIYHCHSTIHTVYH